MKIAKFVYKYMKKLRLYLILFIISNIILWLISIITPYITAGYVDNLVSIKSLNYIYKYSLIILSLGILRTVISYVSTINFCNLQNKITFNIDSAIIEHIKRIPLLKFNNINFAYLVQRIDSDSNSVVSFVLSNLIDIFTNTLTLIISTYLMFNISSFISLILIALIPIYILFYLIFKTKLFNSTYNLKEKQNIYFSEMYKQVANLRFIKLNSLFEILRQKLSCKFKEVMSAYLKNTKIAFAFNSCNSLIDIFAQIIILFLGGMEILKAKLTFSEFIILNSYFNMMMQAINYFLNLGKNYQSALVSYKRIKDLFEKQEEPNGNEALNSINEILMKNITFCYGDRYIFKNFSYKFEKGKIYCIVGENGSGKSTLINLITGLYSDSCSGSIYYNSTNINNLDLYHIRKSLIGVTEQEPAILEDTIINYLTYGMNDVNNEIITEQLNKLNMSRFSDLLSINPNLLLGKDTISGGEKQKLSLSRVLIKDPEILILDEPTSALDRNSVENLKEILQSLRTDKITLIVSHSNKMIDIADEVINLDLIKI